MENVIAVIDRLHALAKEHDDFINRGERPPMESIKRLLAAARMYARAATETHNSFWEQYRRLNRQNEIAKRTGVEFLPARTRLAQLKKNSADAREWMADAGELLMFLLDEWQEAGATYGELLRLCNADYPGMCKQLDDFYSKHEGEDRSFSGLVFVHNLDYKNPRETGWIEDTVDAPMTHCMKEFWFHKLDADPAASEAASIALEQVFPDLMEKAMVMRTDEDGVQRLYDKNGECVGVLGEEAQP